MSSAIRSNHGFPRLRRKDTLKTPPTDSDATAGNPPMSGAQVTRSRQEQIAQLAYSLWQSRGCPDGRPEEDWFQAERQVDMRLSGTSSEP